MVQTMMVSMKGSSRDTMPSRTGSSVDAALWAMDAEPTPASLENAARRKPWISTPKSAPKPASVEKAPFMMVPNALPSSLALATRIHSAASTYTPVITGTITPATLPMLLMPPMITSPTSAAKISP